MKQKSISPIAIIKTDFKEKFGIPRQSGRSPSSLAKIEFLPTFSKNAFREIQGFSHLWLLFDFSACPENQWSELVRPPRLGGNKKVGVFASRSPFRPNGIGLSSVKLESVEHTEQGTFLMVSGADLLDGTPIYDVKPYLPLTDLHQDAKGGYSDEFCLHKLQIDFPPALLEKIPKEKRPSLIECLSDDPRPSYQQDERVYGMAFAEFNIKFIVKENTLVVTEVEQR
jgi:tRNA-Thr(GGU) m(6)t(6)A37 methyltransferase TsaA